MNQSKSLYSYFTFLGLFLLVSGLSYWAFDSLLPAGPKPANNQSRSSSSNNNSNNAAPTKGPAGVLSFQGPQTEVCPINGALYTKEERSLWEQKRPLMVMIENHSDSRPQSGLANADIVYEAVAEGGITRFMGVFYCAAQKGASQKYDVGPVRSARTYFLDLASEYADYPLYTHVGGANCGAPKDPATGRLAGPCTTDKRAQAIEQISDYGWNNQGTWGDLSQFSLPYKVCRREPERTGDVRATEHTMYCSTTALWDTAKERGLTNLTEVSKTSWNKNYKSWQFSQKDTPATTDRTAGVAFDFWGDPSYSVAWKYDSSQNNYIRSNGGKPHLDFNTQKPLTTKNLVIQFAKETRSVDEHRHNLYAVVGSGTGVLLQNGSKTEITWTKSTRTARTVFKDKSGKEVNFVPGTVWVEILPLNTSIKYES
jgi:hypothetical protein